MYDPRPIVTGRCRQMGGIPQQVLCARFIGVGPEQPVLQVDEQECSLLRPDRGKLECDLPSIASAALTATEMECLLG